MIIIKSDREVEIMREAGKVTGEILREVEGFIRPGLTTHDVDAFVEERINLAGMKPAFKGYGGFPAAACVSVNEEIVHGIPSRNRVLKEGDIVSIDTGTIYRGYYSDAARTYPVGEISAAARKLIDVTKESFFRGIEYARVGFRLRDIGHAVQEYAEVNGMGVIRDYTGHGVGRNLHEDPQVPNYGVAGTGPHLKRGMVLAIEPMLALGTYECRTLANGWTVVTNDGKMAAHYENTVAITDGDPILLTI